MYHIPFFLFICKHFTVVLMYTFFTIYTVYFPPRYLDLIFRSGSANRVIFYPVRPLSLKYWILTHLDGTVQTVSVKSVTPSGDC